MIKGSTMADLQEEGKTLVDIQRLIICVMVRREHTSGYTKINSYA